MLAAGAFQALNRRGIRVPEEISVIGLDGSQFGEMLYPALTTIAIDPMNIGREDVRNLIKRIPPGRCPAPEGRDLGEASGTEDLLLKPELLERASVAAPFGENLNGQRG